MAIEKVIIQNFKKFKNPFEVKFNENINLLVGDNESGKSTILEAIHVALTGNTVYWHDLSFAKFHLYRCRRKI